MIPADESERPADHAIEKLRRYQAVVVEFGTLALNPRIDLDQLFQEATERVSRAGGIQHAKVLAYRPETEDLLVVAGVGWKPGVVGRVALPVVPSSPPGRAFLTGEPNSIADIRDAPSYEWSEVLRDHGIHSLLNVPIKADRGSYGVLEVDGVEPHRFSEDATTFLLSMANLLGAAVERRRAEAEVRAAIVTASAERLLLLNELRHRVGNNLQILLAALVKSQREAKTEHSRALIGTVIERLDAIMEAHDALTEGRLNNRVALGIYIERLARNLAPPSQSDLRLETTIGAAETAPERAVTVGLILNEVVTNAFKHAFPDGATGTVRVDFHVDAARNQGVLVIADTGVGMGPGRAGGSGLGLIAALVQKLGGTVKRDTTSGTGGTRYTVRFPL